MSEKEKRASGDWPAIIFLLVALPIAFTFGGFWVGIIVLVIGSAVLGWNKRHDGPFSTNKSGT